MDDRADAGLRPTLGMVVRGKYGKASVTGCLGGVALKKVEEYGENILRAVGA